MKIPDVTPARRGRVNLHGSIPDGRNEEGMRVCASERGDHRRFMENAGAREESQVPNRRGNETPGTNNKQANKNRHPPSPRRLPARGALGVTIFEFSGLSGYAATWDAVAKSKKDASMSIIRYVS